MEHYARYHGGLRCRRRDWTIADTPPTQRLSQVFHWPRYASVLRARLARFGAGEHNYIDLYRKKIRAVYPRPAFDAGGLDRTPIIGKNLCDFLPKSDLLPYVEVIVSVWNLSGRRDNKYKSRIKISVCEKELQEIQRLVVQRFSKLRPQHKGQDQTLLNALKNAFAALLGSMPQPLHFTKLCKISKF